MFMAKSKSNQKYLVILVALALAALGYYGYRSMMVKPDINKVTTGEAGSYKAPNRIQKDDVVESKKYIKVKNN